MPTTSPTIAPSVSQENSWSSSNAPKLNWNQCGSDGSGSFLIGLTSGSGVYISIDSGSTWTQTSLENMYYEWTNVAVSVNGQNLAISYKLNGSGPILYSSDGGNTWAKSNAPTNADWQGIACSSTLQYCIAANFNNHIFYSSDYGVTWTASDSSITTWSSVASTSSGMISYAAVGTNAYTGSVYVSTTYGATWIELSNSPTETWNSLTCDSTGSYIVESWGSGDTGIWYSQDGGTSWLLANFGGSSYTLSGTLISTATSTDGEFLGSVLRSCPTCGANQAQIYLSSNYGKNWYLSNAPINCYDNICSNSDGSQLVSTIMTYTGAGFIMIGQISGIPTNADATGDDALSNVGGSGGLLGIFVAIFFVIAILVGIFLAIKYKYLHWPFSTDPDSKEIVESPKVVSTPNPMQPATFIDAGNNL